MYGGPGRYFNGKGQLWIAAQLAVVQPGGDANAQLAAGKYVVTWAFNYTPNVDTWRAGVVAALTQYSAGGSWDDVVTAFVQGWATQYAAQ